MTRNLILGAGLAGLSASYHLGHSNCLVLEKDTVAFGHARSWCRNGFTWDDGPHVSFTSDEYVKRLFSESVGGEFDEYEVRVGNYYQGHWIDHPAQSNLYQVPEPLRTRCVEGFLTRPPVDPHPPANYAAWLERAFGISFARTFPEAYTRKYWTTDARNLATEWVGSRMFRPSEDEVLQGSVGPLPEATHYIRQVRYPRSGGYQAFGRLLAVGANIEFGAYVVEIDLEARVARCSNGRAFSYERLISTIPLPLFVRSCTQSTPDAVRAAASLSCTQLLLVNVEVPHPALRPENWLYVYDEDKYSTRISFTEKLTPGNAPVGRSGVQIEVYGSKYKPFAEEPSVIAAGVVRELYKMDLIDRSIEPDQVTFSVKSVDWANVIFDHATLPALDTILTWMERYGLEREADDLRPTTDWETKSSEPLGGLALAGRFGQWKYAWSDDCVLRGRDLGRRALAS